MSADPRVRVINRMPPLCGEPLPPFIVRMAEPGILPDRSVRIAELSPDKKRRLWAWLKINNPALAQFLQSDDVTVILQGFPGSSPVLDIDVVKAALA